MLKAQHAAAGAARQCAAGDQLIEVQDAGRNDDRAVGAERLPPRDRDRRGGGLRVAQTAELRAGADRAEESGHIRYDVAVQPGGGVVLVVIVRFLEGGDDPADDLGVVRLVHRRPAAQGRAAGGEYGAGRDREIDQTAGPVDGAEVHVHVAAGRHDPGAACGNVQAVEVLAVDGAASPHDPHRTAGQIKGRVGRKDVVDRRARRGEVQRQPAAVERGVAAVGVGAGEGQGPRPHLRQPAAARDAAGDSRAGGAAQGQGRIAKLDDPARTGQRRRRQVEAVQVERAAVDGDARGRAERRGAAGAQRPAVHQDRSGARIGARQHPGSRTAADQRAVARDDAGQGVDARIAAAQPQPADGAGGEVHGAAEVERPRAVI
ncbi:hypothetical protein D3C87_1179000 [compost metagenome]